MMSGRGRGVRNGSVSIKVERVIRNQDQESSGVYEDEVVYVTKGPRRRGRPRKPATVTSVTPRPHPKPLPPRYPRSNEVIYVSASRGRPQYVIPTRPIQHSTPPLPQRTSTLAQGSRQLAVCAAVCPRPVRCVVTGLHTGQTVVNVPKPAVNLGVPRIVTETKIDWPADLQELVTNWDSLPERRTRDVVKWLQTVSSKGQQPRSVSEIQEIWATMPETWEQKADLALEWLRETEHKSHTLGANTAVNVTPRPNGVTVVSTSIPATTSIISQLRNVALLSVNRAKVLVEAQPNHIQDCNQWSSMSENRENRNN